MGIPHRVQELAFVGSFGTDYHSTRIGNTQCFLAPDTTAVKIPNMIGAVLG